MPRSFSTSLAVSLGALALAIALRWLIDPILGDALPLVTLFGAVAVAVWAGGWRHATLVALLGYAACNLLFIAPRGVLHLNVGIEIVGFVAYAFTCALIVAIGEAMRRARSSAGTQGELWRVTLASIGDAVITTDVDARVTYLNAIAERLTGWTDADARGRPLDEVFRIVGERDRLPADNPAKRALREGVAVGLANHTILIARDGSEHAIDDSAAPIQDEQGVVSGCVLVFHDVSARRSAEHDDANRLLAARQLASIVESSDDAIVRKSLDGTIQSWNAAAERLFGWTAEQAVGRHISMVIPPDRIGEEDQIIASIRAGRRVDHFETVRRTSDGRPIVVSLTISPILDDRGNVVGASKIVRDVTRQRQAEERERKLLADAASANAKFRAFFEQGALFAGIMDLDGTLLDANRLSWEGLGFTREEVVGRKFWDGPWWNPSRALVERIRVASERAAAGEPFREEMPYFVGDGSQRIADVSIQPIRDGAGRILFLASTGSDVTDRKRVEDERQRFVTLVENSTDFVGIWDLDGILSYVNPAGLAMVGLASLDEACRTPVREIFFPEDQKRIVEEFLPEVAERGHGEIEVRFRHFRGSAQRWMIFKALKLVDGTGRPIGFATVSSDITERKRLEVDLRKLANDLSDADRRKDEFLATLAHELRNPLAPLANMIEVVRRSGGDRAALGNAVDMMGRQTAQLVRLVDDLLDLSRITHNRLELRTQRVDLASVIRQAVQSSQPFVDAAGHTLRVTLPDAPVPVAADPVRLTQVFGNLINNSCKYTPPGGTIDVTMARVGDEATVAVRDTGIGIPSDKLETIFEMFTQVDASLERSQGGLGIGLTLVKRLVHMHGGRVVATSGGAGRGSEFVVRLPVAATAHEGATAPVPQRPRPTGRKHHVLIVDDNRDAASSLAMLLELDGHRTIVAYDGPTALEAAEQHRPDVVLLDIGLPGMSGYEVAKRIRRQPWGYALTLIALTGWGQAEDRRRSHEAGFDAHLVKPVDPPALISLLDEPRAKMSAD
ncbi:MAG: PAS domain S-box protein [Vicinamibacteria bacterium]